MNENFLHTRLGGSELRVHRLGLSASYRPGKKTVFKAADAGVNFFFGFGIDTQMVAALREIMQKERARYILATGAYNLFSVTRICGGRLRNAFGSLAPTTSICSCSSAL